MNRYTGRLKCASHCNRGLYRFVPAFAIKIYLKNNKFLLTIPFVVVVLDSRFVNLRWHIDFKIEAPIKRGPVDHFEIIGF